MEIGRLTERLEDFLKSDADHWWHIDEEVYYDGDWTDFQNSFNECHADLLATAVRKYQDEPSWPWWGSLKPNEETFGEDSGIAALLPVMRLSRPAGSAILAGLANGWPGHPECLIPTLINLVGLRIEDLGGTGPFTPSERRGRWYSPTTWNWQPPVNYVRGMIHFPVPFQRRPLAPPRISASSGSTPFRMLYASPVGSGASALLPSMIEIFQNDEADVRLLQYDESDLLFPETVSVIKEPGHKWQLAFRHLSPDSVAEYDFIFFWDDDISAEGFSPKRFAEIMIRNRLEMAQPAILSEYGLSHPITQQHPCPAPFRFSDKEKALPVVGRLTNFVEIMAPVFTRAGWREFYDYLDPDNRSGWGYDYIPLGRKGIVDLLPVVHTRPVQSISGESGRDMDDFTQTQGLFRHAAVNQGWLFG